eukprot:scaffold34507_cov69-Phaeocystis_antarctica.AAC.1
MAIRTMAIRARRVGCHVARRRCGRGPKRGGGRGVRAGHCVQLVHDRPDRTPNLTSIPAPALTLTLALSLTLTRFTTDPITGAYDDGAWWDATLLELCAPYDRTTARLTTRMPMLTTPVLTKVRPV